MTVFRGFTLKDWCQKKKTMKFNEEIRLKTLSFKSFFLERTDSCHIFKKFTTHVFELGDVVGHKF